VELMELVVLLLRSLNFTAINLNPALPNNRSSTNQLSNKKLAGFFYFHLKVASSGAEWTHLNHTDRLSVELNGHLSSCRPPSLPNKWVVLLRVKKK